MKRYFFPTLLMLLPLVAIFLQIMRLTHGNFTYTLDDPYIHLALAENLWGGWYGINLGEVSAPSSSVIWPFMLAPFAILGTWFAYAPLVLNALFLAASGVVLMRIFMKQSLLVASLLAFSLMLFMNLYGLVFSGMEHNLQVLLVLLIAHGLLDSASLGKSSKSRALFYMALVALPLVRYEGLAISVPVLMYGFFQGERKWAVIASLMLLAILGLFTYFLYANGLGYFPTSVMAKSAHASSSSTLSNLMSNIKKYGFMLVPVAMICVHTFKTNRYFACMIALVTLLHFVLGRHGWFGRYEVYYVIFILAISFRYLLDARKDMWVVVFVLPLAFANLIKVTLQTPMASSNIYNQQVQMAEVARILDERVAVNDLGLVALESKQFVLDLAGLGSMEALKNLMSGREGSVWVPELMHKKQVEHAIVYDFLFPKPASNWIKVGELKLLQEQITPADDVVAFYSTSPAAAARLKRALESLAALKRPGDYALTVY